jgi:hypothetical protein
VLDGTRQGGIELQLAQLFERFQIIFETEQFPALQANRQVSAPPKIVMEVPQAELVRLSLASIAQQFQYL